MCPSCLLYHDNTGSLHKLVYIIVTQHSLAVCLSLPQSNDSSSKPLKVTHYHFTAWPDHGVPADKTCMLAFIKRVRKTHPVGGPPLLVHCSAGVGRTGTFIVLDTMVQRMKAEGTLNIYELITDMRKRRVLMVQTEVSPALSHISL